MRWTAKPSPKNGRIRYRYRFALVPTRVRGMIYWLEGYYVEQEYTKWDSSIGGAWFTRRRVTREEALSE